ncbi:alpha/beta-hydrolase [Epithele typhae]|uniref:alpha/beta-hydrolase n=1 Tax=Epithele typhae TaxID=378194 RepID=UPI002008A40F|nr:alpha/beta-hydrolase [Epithele typhae]KAH9933613.1 alpha/beta-hydrolase [Epithele typhae]
MWTTTTTTRFGFSSPRNGAHLTLVAKRYVPPRHAPDGLTLVLSHSTGTHKETWEPFLERLVGVAKHPIREAWAFDMLEHGEGAALNEGALARGGFAPEIKEYSDAIRAFFAAGNFKAHRLVAIGHSVGGPCLLLASAPDEVPGVPFEAIVLIEATMLTPSVYAANADTHDGALAAARGFASAPKRQDTWPDRAAARAFLDRRYPWQLWDARARALYVRHGLRDAPDGSVTLCCSKQREANIYRHHEFYYRAIERMAGIPAAVPVHIVYGDRGDIIPDYVRECLVAVRPAAVVHEVPDAGHAVVQENPDGLADTLSRILSGLSRPGKAARL